MYFVRKIICHFPSVEKIYFRVKEMPSFLMTEEKDFGKRFFWKRKIFSGHLEKENVLFRAVANQTDNQLLKFNSKLISKCIDYLEWISFISVTEMIKYQSGERTKSLSLNLSIRVK